MDGQLLKKMRGTQLIFFDLSENMQIIIKIISGSIYIQFIYLQKVFKLTSIIALALTYYKRLICITVSQCH